MEAFYFDPFHKVTQAEVAEPNCEHSGRDYRHRLLRRHGDICYCAGMIEIISIVEKKIAYFSIRELAVADVQRKKRTGEMQGNKYQTTRTLGITFFGR